MPRHFGCTHSPPSPFLFISQDELHTNSYRIIFIVIVIVYLVSAPTPMWACSCCPFLWGMLSDSLLWLQTDRVCCPAALKAPRVFAALSFLMAVSTTALCLVFALCWTSETVNSYSNTRSLRLVGQALYPTTLLLLTMASTGR